MAPKFDPSEFFVPPSHDLKTPGEKISATIQRPHLRAIKVLAERGRFGWRLNADVIRFCIKKGLDYVDSIDPGVINGHLQKANLMIAAALYAEEQRAHLEAFSRLRDQITNARTDIERLQVKELVTQYRYYVNAMPDDPQHELLWKARYHEDLSRFEEQVESWG